MRARLGVNNCFAAKRWPLPADWARVVRHDLGLDLVELSLDLLEGIESAAGREHATEQTLAALSKEGLTAQTTFTGLEAYSRSLLLHPDPQRRRAALDWYLDVVALTAMLGAKGTGGHVGAMSVTEWSDPELRAHRWAGLQRDLAEITGCARSRGLDYVLVENLASNREPSTIASIESLLSDGDDTHAPIRLCLDLGHQCVPGTAGDDRDPYAWLRRFGASLAEVQLQQSDGIADRHWPFTAEHNAQGRIDPGRVLDTLAAAGAQDVLLVLEVIPAWEQDDEQVIADLRASADTWTAAMRERGLC